MKTQMSFQNACVCDANADQKLTRYCRVHITRRDILLTANKIVASADLPLSFRAPLVVGSDPEELVRLLHASYGVQFVVYANLFVVVRRCRSKALPF